ncbi:MAG: thiamine phosphate synthase [Planctomycetota bacterium]
MTNPLVGYVECARIAGGEGVPYVQLRMKTDDIDAHLRTAIAVCEALEGSETVFIVNDDIAVARDSDADGAHLGQDDLSIDEARRLWNQPGKIIGLSTHGIQQAQLAQTGGADYIGVGPVFPTPTKAIADPTVGLENLKVISGFSTKPCVAIGGISETNLADVLSTGVKTYALVRAVCGADDPARVIRALRAIETKGQ